MLHTSHKSALQISEECILTATGKQLDLEQELDDENGTKQESERARGNTWDTEFHCSRLCLLTSEISLEKVLAFDNQKRRSSMSAPTNPSPSQSWPSVWNQNQPCVHGQGNLEQLNTHRTAQFWVPISKYTLSMHQCNANHIFNPTRTPNGKSSQQKCYWWHPERIKRAFTLKSHPKTTVTKPSFRHEKLNNCQL